MMDLDYGLGYYDDYTKSNELFAKAGWQSAISEGEIENGYISQYETAVH